MTTINAQTIINAVNAAAAVAPTYFDGATLDAMPSGTPHGYDGAAEYGELAVIEAMPYGYCYAADQARKQADKALDTMQDAARAELRALLDVPCKVKIQTAARGFMRLINTRERLQAFAATVRSNAKAFGGGLVRVAKAKPAQAYSAGAVRMVRELIQDHDYTGALELAESKAGALFYKHNKQAFMLLAPMECAELPGLLVAQHESGHYVAFEPVSGMAISGLHGTNRKTRAGAIEDAAAYWNSKSEDAKAAGMQRAHGSPCDQAAARAAWIEEHGIQDAAELAARIEASEAAPESTSTASHGPDLAVLQAMAAQDVAQMVANATAAAAAAIEQASEAAAPQELATCEAAEPVRELATVCEASTAHSTQQNSASISSGTTRGSIGAPGAPGGYISGQTVRGKSGRWSALLFSDLDGKPCMRFADSDPIAFSSGRERMQALQDMAKQADTPASASRAPRDYVPQSIAFDLRGITWKIEVSRYWKIDAVAESQQPDLLTWTAYKKGGRYALQHFTRVAGDNVPRDVATRAHAFWLECCAADTAAPSAAGLIPPSAASATSTGAADTPTDAADYTDSRKTLETNGAELHNTPQDLEIIPPAAATPGALQITIIRAEGLSHECGVPVTVGSFEAAQAILLTWSETAPKGGAYNKCDFSITWADGGTYSGRYDLKHHTEEAPSLARHMIDFAEFETGLFCPAHMSEKQYAAYLDNHSDSERKAYFAAVLETLRGLGVYFPRMRPIAFDLRALVQSGIAPAQLVGLGVDYTPKHMNDSTGTGAIVESSECAWRGVRVVVYLEGGRVMHADAEDFADGGEYRINSKVHGAPYLAELAAAVATQRASFAASRTQAEQAHAAELVRLALEYPQLKKSEGRYTGGKHAAINARILLKQHFSGVKFSVTSDYSSLSISWTGGPTDAAVNEIIGRFDIGASDTQSDYFYTVSTAWSELFGGAQYVNTHRTATEEEARAALVALFGEDGPSFEDWKAQKMWSQVQHGTRSGINDEWHWLNMVRRYMNGETDI